VNVTWPCVIIMINGHVTVYHYNNTRPTVTRWSYDSDHRYATAFQPISEAAHNWSYDNVSWRKKLISDLFMLNCWYNCFTCSQHRDGYNNEDWQCTFELQIFWHFWLLICLFVLASCHRLWSVAGVYMVKICTLSWKCMPIGLLKLNNASGLCLHQTC